VEVALRGKALAQDEREDISRGLAAGLSMRAIARSLGRNVKAILREIARRKFKCDDNLGASSPFRFRPLSNA
jgi:IS30 family transposase